MLAISIQSERDNQGVTICKHQAVTIAQEILIFLIFPIWRSVTLRSESISLLTGRARRAKAGGTLENPAGRIRTSPERLPGFIPPESRIGNDRA